MSAPLLRPPDWTVQAACQGIAGPDLDPWHPPDHLTAAEQAAQYALARLVCSRCPVRHPCALEALHEGIGHGVWGGLDPADRRRIARKHGYPNPGAAPHGEYSRYVTCTLDQGRPCADCREAKRRYMAGRRAQGLERRRRRTGTPPPALVLVLGHGRHRAWPGQYVLFPDLFPAGVLLRPADTTGRSVVA